MIATGRRVLEGQIRFGERAGHQCGAHLDWPFCRGNTGGERT